MTAPISSLLLKKVLEHADQYEWSLQGFGMLRTYLSKECRLHVWDPAMAVPNVTTIHTHPWDFTSHVLVGGITDVVYREYLAAPFEGDTSVLPFHKQPIVCGAGGGMAGEPVKAYLYKMRQITMVEHDRYGHKAEEIHESQPAPGTVTLVERSFKPDTEHAFVYYAEGSSWVSAEPRPATTAEVRAMTKLALGRMR